jgi:hypothetical protein
MTDPQGLQVFGGGLTTVPGGGGGFSIPGQSIPIPVPLSCHAPGSSAPMFGLGGATLGAAATAELALGAMTPGVQEIEGFAGLLELLDMGGFGIKTSIGGLYGYGSGLGFGLELIRK